MSTLESSIPPLYGLRKDHKQVPIEEEKLGPPTRPVCGATKSPNGALSNILSEVLERLSDCEDMKIGTECRSTEEMIAEFNRINGDVNEEGEKVIFSTDVKALYPSLKANYVADVISKMYEESDLRVRVDNDELSLYLALVAEAQEISEYGLQPVVKRWKNEGRGRRPGITTAEVMGGRTQRNDSKFLPAERKPNPEEERRMIALALKKGVQAVMKNHLYKIDNKVYQQSDGGPIGLQVTGAIARAFMIWWDGKFMERLREATENMEWRCHMYMRYVDDGNVICTPFPSDCELIEGKVVRQQHNEGSGNERQVIPDDRNTAEIVKQIANSVCDFIQVEIDFPSAHESRHMPILDVEVTIVENAIRYRHYRKEIANPLVIHHKSAMPEKVKRKCLSNEVIRMMRNTSREQPEEVRKFFLSDFSQRMRMSGYQEKFRREIITSGMRGYERMLRNNDEGVCPLHRSKGYRKEERMKEKYVKKRSWYKPCDAVLFCPSTPRGELAQRMRKVTNEVSERHRMKVKVIERGGVSIKNQLMRRKDKNRCRNREECIVHGNGGKGDCSIEGVVYRGTCLTCKERGPASKPNTNGEIIRIPEGQRRSVESVYFGETSRSCFTRGKQHLQSLANPENPSNRSNAFVRHREDFHTDEEENVQYRVDVVKAFKRPLERQVWEGVEIHSSSAGVLMNSKLDHYQPAVGRMTMTFDL